MDERGSVWLRESCGNSAQESLHLDLSMGAEARGDAVEIAVVVAGMTDQLEGSGCGHRLQDLVEGRGVEIAGCGDSEGSVGREDTTVLKLRVALEGGAKAVEEMDL